MMLSMAAESVTVLLKRCARIAPAFLLFAFPLSAQDGPELVRMLQHRGDVRGRGRLVRTGEDKQQRVLQVSMLRKLLPRSANMLWSLAGGPRLLVEARFGGPVRIFRDAPEPLPQRRWTEPVAETDFTIEDLAETHFFWPKQTVVRTEKCGAHECLVLRSEPEEGAATAYSEVQSWVDRTALIAVRMVKKRKGGEPSKEFVTRGLRQVGSTWGASTVEARTQGAAAYTRLVFTSGSEKVKVQAAEVEPAAVFAK